MRLAVVPRKIIGREAGVFRTGRAELSGGKAKMVVAQRLA